MTILDNISNKTLKRAYVCPSLEVITPEEEDCLLNATFVGEVPDEEDGDKDGEDLNPKYSKKYFGDNYFLLDDDWDD